MPPMSPGEEGSLRIETLLREVNLRIEELERRVAPRRRYLPLLCECATAGCASPIEVEAAVFRRARQKPLRFFVARGHERVGSDTVIARLPGYLIVERTGSG